MKKALCIGGPLDGHREHVNEMTAFDAMVHAGLPTTMVANAAVVVDSQPKKVRYTLRTFHADGQEPPFWVPEGTTDFQAMVTLAEGYKP